MNIKISIFMFFTVLYFATFVHGGNMRYMATTGTDTGDCTDLGSPCATLAYSFSRMSGGDTLQIADGAYTGTSNIINNTQYPPLGSSGDWTEIYAENPGGVTINGEGSNRPVHYNGSSTNGYWDFNGIVFYNSPDSCITISQVSYLKFKNCGVVDAGGTVGDGINIGNCSYALIEDCYSWGDIRYNFSFYAVDHGIMRRNVVRKDVFTSTSWALTVGHQVYNSQYCEVQNCVFIDSDSGYYDVNYTRSQKYGFKIPQDNLGDVYFRGCISINAPEFSGIFIDDDTPGGASITNCTFAGSAYGMNLRSAADMALMIIDHNTVVNMSESGTNGDTDKTITNSIFLYCASYGLYKWSGELYPDYNVLFNNGANYSSGITPGANDYSSENGSAIDPYAGSLEYLLRIEPGSSLSGTASDSGDRGATIMYKIGLDGTFYGDTGYNTLRNVTNGYGAVNDQLWPFPNENLIKSKMQAYTWDDGSGGTPEVSGDRGFASSTAKQLDGVSDVTLTSYIWEYLGNQIPGDIYEVSGLTCYLDADGDMYSDGTSETNVEACSTNYFEAGNLTATSEDCDDSNASINPDATEICGNAVDEDCDGTAQSCSSCSVNITSGPTSSQASYTLTALLTAGTGTISGVTVNGTSVDCADGTCDEAGEELSYPVSLVVGNNPFNVAIADDGAGCSGSTSVNYSQYTNRITVSNVNIQGVIFHE